MNLYETAFLIAPNLSEEETEEMIQQMAEVIAKKKGKMINIDKWGKRKLAYLIGKFDSAFYVFFHYKGGTDIPAELERRFKQKETIIRYLTVRQEETANIRKKKVAEKRKARAMREEPAAVQETEPVVAGETTPPETPPAEEEPAVKEPKEPAPAQEEPVAEPAPKEEKEDV